MRLLLRYARVLQPVALAVILAVGTPAEVIGVKHPFIEKFFLGDRGKRALEVLRDLAVAG